jgi:Protein of unknown function (DUF4031)
MSEPLTYYCDHMRHLVCVPYSIDTLHRMAEDLGIKRCWYHAGKGSDPHYDIPLRRVAEIQARCTVVPPREVLRIIREGHDGLLRKLESRRLDPK